MKKINTQEENFCNLKQVLHCPYKLELTSLQGVYLTEIGSSNSVGVT